MTHFTRYTKDAANPAKLVVYDFRDNEPDVAGSRINAEFLLKKTTKVTIPAQTNNFTYYEVDDGLMIQTGASKDDSVAIHLYDVSSGRYGLNLRGNVELIESKYSYSTTSTTRTENYSYKEPIKNTKYIPGYTYFNAHGERVNVGAKMEVEITGWNTIVGTRTITTQEKTLIGVTQEKNPKVLDNVDSALNKLNSVRTTLGAYQNRLEHTKQVDNNTQENTQAAESRIRDTDMAEEMVDYSKHNILEQAGQSMLAQANQSAQGVLQLLG